jgi:hypothetical protein
MVNQEFDDLNPCAASSSSTAIGCSENTDAQLSRRDTRGDGSGRVVDVVVNDSLPRRLGFVAPPGSIDIHAPPWLTTKSHI